MIAKEKLIRVLGVVSIVLLFAGCATQKYGEFTPKGALAPSTGTAYATYKKAMRHCDGYSMAYEWQRENQKIVEEATRPETIAAFVETAAAADVLLAKIGTSYDGDPVVLTQIAAVTQFVICPKRPKSPELRSLWVAALERTRAASDDGYVKTFCDQQLRLCK